MWRNGRISEQYKERAKKLFQNSRGDLHAALIAMTSEHAAKGRLQSGLTARRAVAIFEEQSCIPLDAALSEAAKLIQHHGAEWNAAMSGIGEALEEHIREASNQLKAPFRNAGLDKSPAAQEAASGLLFEACDRLRSHLNDYRDGWTAPRPIAFKDRHPLLYQMVLLAIGGGITLALSIATGWLKLR